MIRQAEPRDYEIITDIRESMALDVDRLDDPEYRLQVQRSGFLLLDGPNKREFVSASVLNYDLAERDGETVGYVRLEDEQDISEEENTYWLRPDMREMYYSNPHAYVVGIGVLPQAKGQGVAAELLEAAEKRTRAKSVSWLFSEIVTFPITNIASMIFHEKNGFRRVAIGEPREHLGMQGFHEILYAKQLL